MITLQKWFSIVGNKSRLEGDQLYVDKPGLTFLTAVVSSGTFDSPDSQAATSIIFETNTLEVFGVDVCDYNKDKAYRILDKSIKMDKLAWDGVNFIDLETDEDFIEKMTAIVNGDDYDDRIVVPLDMSDEELFFLMKRAHEHDMTLNQYIEYLTKILVNDNEISKKEI